jgi:DNA-binding CsgD family transcriptional regulator
MLSRVRLEAAGRDIDPMFVPALPVAFGFDLNRPAESLGACVRHVDTGFVLDVSAEHPLGWSFVVSSGVERLKAWADAGPVICLGDLPDRRFALNVLIPTYQDAVAADRPVEHHVTAVANKTFLAYRKLTIPIHVGLGRSRASHILTLTRLDHAIQLTRAPEEYPSLAARERRCLSLAASGLVCKQIAAEIGISEKTVELHLARVRQKYGARTTAHAIAMNMAMAMIQ